MKTIDIFMLLLAKALEAQGVKEKRLLIIEDKELTHQKAIFVLSIGTIVIGIITIVKLV